MWNPRLDPGLEKKDIKGKSGETLSWSVDQLVVV